MISMGPIDGTRPRIYRRDHVVATCTFIRHDNHAKGALVRGTNCGRNVYKLVDVLSSLVNGQFLLSVENTSTGLS